MVLCGLVTVAVFSVAGYPLIVIAAEGSDAIADMAYTYMAITARACDYAVEEMKRLNL